MKLFAFFLGAIDFSTAANSETCHITENMISTPRKNIEPGLKCTRSNQVTGADDINSTEFRSFPWQVRLTSPQNELNCAGSIISDNWILTSARCCDGKKDNEIHVQIGDFHYEMKNRGDFSVVSEQVIQHPGEFDC